MKIQRFEDLECLPCGIRRFSAGAKLFLRGWQQARMLVNMVYDAIKASRSFQKDFRLVNQITGAAVSVMNNIARPVK